MSHSAKLISALLVVAATAGTALAASVSPPSRGTGDFDTMRAAPISFPDFAAMPTPKVDPDAQGRGPLDEAMALESYGTITLNRDGSIEETPVSEALRDLIIQMLANPGN
ncbi:MAG: hypothetical protein ABIO40_04450 [Devosia sp.]